MNRLSKFCYCIVIGFCSDVVLAEPDQTTRWAISNSVSMLDWGVFRVSDTINKAKPFGDLNGFTSVTYSYENNTVDITGFLISKDQPFEKQKDVCMKWVASIRSEAGVNEDGTLLIAAFKSTLFSDFFTHQGYISNSMPKDFKKNMDKKFTLLCKTLNRKFKANLLGDEIYEVVEQ